MTILLYQNIKLDERDPRPLQVWKVWHVILFVLAAVFGIINYVFLKTTLEIVNDRCILYPRYLEFHMVEKSQIVNITITEKEYVKNDEADHKIETVNIGGNKKSDDIDDDNVNMTNTVSAILSENLKDFVTEDTKGPNKEFDKGVNERENNTSDLSINKTESSNLKRLRDLGNKTSEEIIVVIDNVTYVIENATHRMMLDIPRTLFGRQKDCDYSEFMPLLSTIFAIVWTTLFIICPGGGRVRSGLQEPWRIMTPALLFVLVVVILTGHSFSLTNGGLQDFCAAFSNFTGSTACSPVDRFLECGWKSTWCLGQAASAARASSAGAWASWACAAAVLLARCLGARDFIVRRTGVYLARDPSQKITPYLRKTPKTGRREVLDSAEKRDNVSVKSEPTVTTELVTATVEHPQDSTPTSLTATLPIKHDDRQEILDLTHSPQELFNSR